MKQAFIVGILVKLFIFDHDNFPKLVAVSKIFTLLLPIIRHSHETTSMYPFMHSKFTRTIQFQTKDITTKKKKNLNGQQFTETGSLGKSR